MLVHQIKDSWFVQTGRTFSIFYRRNIVLVRFLQTTERDW